MDILAYVFYKLYDFISSHDIATFALLSIFSSMLFINFFIRLIVSRAMGGGD